MFVALSVTTQEVLVSPNIFLVPPAQNEIANVSNSHLQTKLNEGNKNTEATKAHCEAAAPTVTAAAYCALKEN